MHAKKTNPVKAIRADIVELAEGVVDQYNFSQIVSFQAATFVIS